MSRPLAFFLLLALVGVMAIGMGSAFSAMAYKLAHLGLPL